MGLMENGTTWLQRCLYVVTVAVLSSPTLHCLLYTFLRLSYSYRV